MRLSPFLLFFAGASFLRGPVSYVNQGADWKDGQCGSRDRQSPVNFERLEVPPSGDFRASGFDAINVSASETDTEGIKIPLVGGGVEVDGWAFSLKSARVHAGAEHTFRGERRAAEIQFEHASADPLRYGTLFLSLTFTSPHEQDSEPLPDKLPGTAPSGDKDFSAAFEELLAALDGKSAEMVDVQSLIAPTGDADPAYMVYGGSRTAPPCEDAKWLVKRTPVRVSSVQLALLVRASRKAAKNNYRTIMPLPLTTTVSILTPDFSQLIPAGPKEPSASHGPRLPSGPNPRTDRERRALFASKAAKAVAADLGAKIASLDGRAQRAAMARRNALSPTTTPPIDFGRGRLPAKDALVIAESIASLAPQLGGELHHQIQQLHYQIENAAHTGARQVVDNMWDGVKEWYEYHAATTTPVPPPPPRPPPPPPPKKKYDFPEAEVHWPLPTPSPTPGPTEAPTPAPEPPHGPTRWPPMTTTAAPAHATTTAAPAAVTTAPALGTSAAPAATTARASTTAGATTTAATTTFGYAAYTTTAATTTAYMTSSAPFTTTFATTTPSFGAFYMQTSTTTGYPFAYATTTRSPYLSYTTTGTFTANPYGYTTTGYATASPYSTTTAAAMFGATTGSYLSYGATTTANPLYTTTAFTTTAPAGFYSTTPFLR
jgi:carbonic anhydrase/outer membrane biosynthesis protein TonB